MPIGLRQVARWVGRTCAVLCNWHRWVDECGEKQTERGSLASCVVVSLRTLLDGKEKLQQRERWKIVKLLLLLGGGGLGAGGYLPASVDGSGI